LNNFALSAYKNNLDPFEVHSAKSLMEIINNNDPKIGFFGIPLRICRQKEKLPSTRTLLSSIN